MKAIIIGIAELLVVRCPQNVTTLGLGSCVGVTLYDKVRKVGGMVHIMLPDSMNKPDVNMAKFADVGIHALLEKMLSEGAVRSAIEAKMAGGAHMFGSISKNSILRVGERNSEVCISVLKKLNIPVLAQDLGGEYGRTIELDTQDGRLLVKAVGRGQKYI